MADLNPEAAQERRAKRFDCCLCDGNEGATEVKTARASNGQRAVQFGNRIENVNYRREQIFTRISASQHFRWVRSRMTNIVGDASNQIGPLPVHADKPLEGRTALVVGVANKDSIAYGIARALRGFGADVALTYQDDKTRRYTEELAMALEVRPELFLKCDVRVEGQMESVMDALSERWGKLNVLIHSIAFAPKTDLHGRVTDVSLPGFLTAMEVSVWSLLRLTHLAEPLLAKEGGSIFTMSYFGGEKVVPQYGIMGPVKSALETAAQYMAAELGSKRIRVNIVSPGAVMTRAASGIGRFDELLERTKEKSPSRSLVTPEQVGYAVAALAADWGSIITGEVLHLDGGYNIMGAH